MSELTVKEMQDFIRAEVERGTSELLNGLLPTDTKRLYKEINEDPYRPKQKFHPVRRSTSTTRVEASIFGNVVPGVFTKDPDELCEFDRAVINSILE